jgi:CheY-like chemotaxis protein
VFLEVRLARILLVDDDADVRKLAKRILEKDGHMVMVIDNGLSALDELNKNPYDLLISDASMPQYSGFDLIRALRRQPKHKDLIVAMLTGRREKTDIQNAIELGVKEYIVKPIDPPVLVAKVHNLVAHTRESELVVQKEIKANLEARLESHLKITKIGLIGFKAITNIPLNAGMEMYLNVDDFASDSMPRVKIIHCTIDPENANQFFLQGEFMDLDDELKNEISNYIQQNLEAA